MFPHPELWQRTTADIFFIDFIRKSRDETNSISDTRNSYD
jgi:hypothetical protein